MGTVLLITSQWHYCFQVHSWLLWPGDEVTK